MKAFVLAGGLGLRLRGVVSGVPKPLADVQGTPFLMHLIKYLEKHGIDDLILCVGYKGEAIRDRIGSRYGQCNIRYSFEPIQLGTGGALFNALERFPTREPFLVLNGDTFFQIDLSSFLRVNSKAEWIWKLALFPASDSARYGEVAVGNASEVVGVQSPDKTNASTTKLFYANSGVWLCRGLGPSENLKLPAPFSMEEYLGKFLENRDHRVVAEVFEAPFVDIGLPSDYERVQTLPQFAVTADTR